MRGRGLVGLVLQLQFTGDNGAHRVSFRLSGGLPIDPEALTAGGAFDVLFCIRSSQ
jgi:hypothetical protein